jgi:Double-GTPase 2
MPVLGYIALGILALLAVVLYLALAAALVPAIALTGGAALAAYLLWTYLRTAQRVLVPRPAPADDPLIRLPPGGDAEPAYYSYYAGQVVADMRSVTTSTWTAARRAVQSPAVRGLRRWLLTGRPQPGLPVSRLEGQQLLFAAPAGIALGAAAVVGILAAFLVAAAIQLIHVVFLAIIAASLALAGLILRTVDALRLAVRKIHMKCPHPGCYARITRPYYRCSSGQHEHRRLQPGRYGIVWRTCACGERLPTLFVFKLHRINAWCPHCNRPVPSGLGSAPLIHIPMIGGTNVGKTALLTAIVDSLEWLAGKDELSVEFASDVSRKDYEAAKELLRSGNWPHATTAHVPHAFLLYVRQPHARRRLVYLYDPRGEVFQKADSVREQEYLESAGGIIFVIDPFAVPAARHLPAADEEVGQAARPSPDDPDKTYARVAGELRDVLGPRWRRTPVAVVATKLDAVEKAQALPHPQDPGDTGAVTTWLSALGLTNLTLSLGLDFNQVRYWATSAYTSSGPPSAGGETQRRNTAACLLWLLSRA